MDADQGLNSRVRYVLLPNSEGADGPFNLDATSGILRTIKALDRESVAKYELVVQAVDRGTPELTGVASVTVIVEDVNDSPPQFDGTTVDGRVRLFITENSPVGAKVKKKYIKNHFYRSDINYCRLSENGQFPLRSVVKRYVLCGARKTHSRDT